MQYLIAEQSHEAFSELVMRHAPRFRSVAYRQIGLREEAEDIVQSAFLKIWIKPDMWRSDHQTKFTTWFYRIILNQCFDYQKRKKPRPFADGEDFIDDVLSQEDNLFEKQKEARVEAAFRRLPTAMQTALNLGFYEKVSNQEAAELMGLSLKAYQSLLIRAKRQLKDLVFETPSKQDEPQTMIKRGQL